MEITLVTQVIIKKKLQQYKEFYNQDPKPTRSSELRSESKKVKVKKLKINQEETQARVQQQQGKVELYNEKE